MLLVPKEDLGVEPKAPATPSRDLGCYSAFLSLRLLVYKGGNDTAYGAGWLWGFMQ